MSVDNAPIGASEIRELAGAAQVSAVLAPLATSAQLNALIAMLTG